MASDGNSGQIPNAGTIHPGSGNAFPPGNKIAAFRGSPQGPAATTAAATTATAGAINGRPAATTVAAPATTGTPTATTPTAAATTAQGSPDPQALVAQLNKLLNDSGLPDQFRLDPAGKFIQQINPATGTVVCELPASEFPALARTAGTSGLLLDSLA